MLIDQLHTRRQVAELTGLPDDVLAYWVKAGLLVPSTGGEGRGSHRRFDCLQITLAAILGHLRRFGSNITTLKAVADLFQRAIRLDATYRLNNPYYYSTCAGVAETIHKFRNGEVVSARIYPSPKSYDYIEIPMCSESEILDERLSHLGVEDDFDLQTLRKICSEVSPSDVIPLRLADPLTYEIRTGTPTDNIAFLMALDENDQLQFNFSSSNLDFTSVSNSDYWSKLESGIMISFTAIINRLWRDDMIVLHQRHNAAMEKENREYRAARLAECDRDDPKEAARLRRIWGIHT